MTRGTRGRGFRRIRARSLTPAVYWHARETVFVRTYKKARFSLAGRTYNSEFLWIIMVLSELFLVAK